MREAGTVTGTYEARKALRRYRTGRKRDVTTQEVPDNTITRKTNDKNTRPLPHASDNSYRSQTKIKRKVSAMETKIKFSDILRYILLGAIVCAFAVSGFFGDTIGKEIRFSEIVEDAHEGFSEAHAVIYLVVFLAVSFFTGLLLQSVRIWFEGLAIKLLEHIRRCTADTIRMGKAREIHRRTAEYCRRIVTRRSGRLQSVPGLRPETTASRSGTNEKNRKRLRKSATRILHILIYGSVYQVCYGLRYGKRYRSDIPYWIYLSNEPDATLARLSEFVQQDDNRNGHESLYMNQLFMGLSFLSLILLCLSLSVHDAIGDYKLTVVFAVSLIVTRMLARMFALEYIKTVNITAEAIDTQRNANDTNDPNGIKTYNSLIYKSLGRNIPHVYVLMRTTGRNLGHIREALDSIAMQRYPKCSVIILEDVPAEGERNAGLDEILGSSNDSRHTLSIIYKRAERHLGAAAASIEIRRHFMDTAAEGDIAVLLDDDDRLARPDAVSEIVLRMNAADADMCLCAFANINDMNFVLSNNRGYYHNRVIVPAIANKPRAIRFSDYPELTYTDTLGWTKCYRYDLMKRYLNSVEEFDNTLDAEYRFASQPAYEDFYDFVCYLFSTTRITAVERPVYKYRNHPESITARPTVEAFRFQRTHFLAYLHDAVQYGKTHEWAMIPEAEQAADHFIAYKIGVIRDIIATKLKGNAAFKPPQGYTQDRFFNDAVAATGLDATKVQADIDSMSKNGTLKCDAAILSDTARKELTGDKA